MIPHTIIAFILFSATCAIIGSWLFLERKSLFADTIAHATFPGLTLMILIIYNAHFHNLIFGAFVSCFIAMYVIKILSINTTLKKDTILGIVLASSFGLGTLFLSKIQHLHIMNSGLITKYFLGNPATILHQDCNIIIILSLIALIIFFIFKNKYNVMIFDPILASMLKINAPLIFYSVISVIICIIIAGMQIVGIILMSSLLINPNAAAYQWTKNFNKMIFLSACFGVIATLGGIYISSIFYHIPAAPMIVIIATLITSLSILLSPTGIIIAWYQTQKKCKNMDTAQILSQFLLFNEAQTDPHYTHNIKVLACVGKSITHQQLLKLQNQGFIYNPQKDFWALTPDGIHFLKQHKNVLP